MSRMLLIIYSILASSLAFAQIDDGPDGLGIYFDEGATSASVDSDGQTAVHAYLILTNPTEDGAIEFWRALVVSYDTPPDVIFGIPRFGENQAVPMPGSPYFFFKVTNVGGEPNILSRITILADLYIEPNADLSQIALFLIDQMKYSTVGEDGPFVEMNPSSGSRDRPVAVIDGPDPVSVVVHSWGELKALYR